MQKESQSVASNNFHEKKANKIIAKCLWQNDIFRKQATQKHWKAVHSSHYDWWAFPINQKSSYGEEFKVSHFEISIMKNSEKFMVALSENAIIVCEAWGWDLVNGKIIKTNDQDQKWQDWPIRLYKMAKSLEIFGLNRLFKNAVKYGIEIMKTGRHLQYGRRNISEYMNEKWAEISLSQKSQTLNENQSQKTQQKTEKQKCIILEGKQSWKKDQFFTQSHLQSNLKLIVRSYSPKT